MYLFHSRHLPLGAREIKHLSHHPVRMIHEMWQWQWHGLVVWAIVAAILMPLMAMYLRRALVLMMKRHKALIHSRPATH